MSETLSTTLSGLCDELEAALAVVDELKARARAVLVSAPALAPLAQPDAIVNDEFRLWLLVKQLTDEAREQEGDVPLGAASLATVCGRLRTDVQTYLWQRMEEVNVPSRKFPDLGVQFVQTHAVYPGLNREAVAAQGLSTEEANAVVIEFVEAQGAPELVDRDPRVNWQRMRGEVYLKSWLKEGVLLPDVINAVPKPTVSIRKL